MRLRTSTLLFLLLLLASAAAPVLAGAQDAKALRAEANAEPNQEKQVQLLCRAADLEPKNKDFRKDCDVSKAALISSDKQSLKTALDASDAGQTAKAERYAKYVSGLDPETHRQAAQLLARLAKPEAAPATTASATPAPAAPNQSATLLAQATSALEAGNLGAARTAAQSVTDPSLKPLANRITNDIERYTTLVAAGQHQEQMKEYAQAEHSLQAALEVNSHVASDDLNGRLQRLQQMASAQATPSAPSSAAAPAAMLAAKQPPPRPSVSTVKDAKAQPAQISPEDRKRLLLEASAQAMNRNDLEAAGRTYKEVLDLDPSNAEARHGIVTINAMLSRDPVRLEKTLHDAIVAFYASRFEDAESGLNRYLGADGGKRKGAAYFYLGATEATLAILDQKSKRRPREQQATEDFKQARLAGYQPIPRYVSAKILAEWNGSAG